MGKKATAGKDRKLKRKEVRIKAEEMRARRFILMRTTAGGDFQPRPLSLSTRSHAPLGGLPLSLIHLIPLPFPS